MRLIVIAAILASTSAFACPNLAGSYQACKSSQGDSAGMEISQRVENGITIIESTSINEETGEVEKDIMIADGVSRSTTDSEGMVTTNRVSCEGDKLIIEAKFSEPTTGISGSALSTTSRDGQKLVSHMKGDFMGEVMEDSIVCE